MKKALTLLVTSALVAGLVGCKGDDQANTDAAPKGEKPVTVTAPPGAKNPEERGMEAQQKADQDGGANK